MLGLATLIVELPEDRWQPRNGMYGRADAAVLRGMVRHHRPTRALEIGSGYSTAVTLDAAARHLPGLRITCVESNRQRLRYRLRPGDDMAIIKANAQDVPLESFTQLEARDVLFIDSSHVLKHGSEVVWLYLHVLPVLAPGVIVHVHNVHCPFKYPERWLREGRDSTEAHLLRALLTHNDVWKVRPMMGSMRMDLGREFLCHEPTDALWMQCA
ncbi:class I SAM-dependent methyltransferase [Janibacter cremeus]|uniref:class I SAM-dependent methyltransferase n=1 Tax=Janibacter cremeus TaxID=1285192 RepID=UPI0023F6A4E4|nr:class I SAM-dependent methyltransferase [Janibacter cremeus]WEV76932.1 class I SAM-dependent methyltransferase [Janibacter cremeus]